MIKLIIGLGNPGEKYQQTRHNIGFITVNLLKKDFNFNDWKMNKKINSFISQGIFSENKKIILAKPQTMMNNSGQAAMALINYYKTTPQNLIIIHDDIDLKIGDYKIQQNRGAAGHKGVQSIINQLGTKAFIRLRLGIKPKQMKDPTNTEKFVLQKFSEQEIKIANQAIEKAVRDLRTAL